MLASLVEKQEGKKNEDLEETHRDLSIFSEKKRVRFASDSENRDMMYICNEYGNLLIMSS